MFDMLEKFFYEVLFTIFSKLSLTQLITNSTDRERILKYIIIQIVKADL